MMHSAAEEDDFMKNLLSGINDDFFLAHPSPHTTPSKPRQTLTCVSSPENLHKPMYSIPSTPNSQRSTTKKRKRNPRTDGVNQEQVDLEGLLMGADDWDWNDMVSPTHIKVKRRTEYPQSSEHGQSTSKSKPTPSPVSSLSDESCTRCLVESVEDVAENGVLQKVNLLSYPTG